MFANSGLVLACFLLFCSPSRNPKLKFGLFYRAFPLKGLKKHLYLLATEKYQKLCSTS